MAWTHTFTLPSLSYTIKTPKNNNPTPSTSLKNPRRFALGACAPPRLFSPRRGVNTGAQRPRCTEPRGVATQPRLLSAPTQNRPLRAAGRFPLKSGASYIREVCHARTSPAESIAGRPSARPGRAGGEPGSCQNKIVPLPRAVCTQIGRRAGDIDRGARLNGFANKLGRGTL